MCLIIVVNQTHIRVMNEIYNTLIQKNEIQALSQNFLKKTENAEKKLALDHKLVLKNS